MLGRFDETLWMGLMTSLACAPGPSLGEEPRRKVLERYFTVHSVPYRVDSAGNLHVQMGNGEWEDTIVLDAHIDVVQNGCVESVGNEGRRIRGLGLGDNLTAVALLAMAAVVMNRETGAVVYRPVHILFSIGEEGQGNLAGIREFVGDHPTPPYAFVSFDLSFETYSVAALGSVRYSLEVRGPGGHSWEDYGTPNPVDWLIGFFTEVRREFDALKNRCPDGLSFTIGRIEGGEGINSIPRQATAAFEFRSVDQKLLETLDRDLMRLTERLGKVDGLSIRITPLGWRPAAWPVKPERIEPLALKVLSAIGETPVPVVRSTNINATLDAGWPSLCMGLCRSGRFHSMDEYVELDSVENGWRVLGGLIEGLAAPRRTGTPSGNPEGAV